VKRLATILVLLAAGTVLVLGTGAGNAGSYKVRAIFDNAFGVISGEDVKIAGVRVGKIDSLAVTPQQ
jgi:ABC-type transporter Mla subunit MlaD